MQKKFAFFIFWFPAVFSSFAAPCGNAGKEQWKYTVSMEDAATHVFRVELVCSGVQKSRIEFCMPVWTPGYYQVLNYAQYVDQFHATGANGDTLEWEKKDANTWSVITGGGKTIHISYHVKSKFPFVANNYADADRAFISPPGMFFYPPDNLQQPVSVKIIPAPGWTDVATGLDTVPGERYTFRASGFDELFDAPILAGKLESFPQFYVSGKPHRFVAYKPGTLDAAAFMQDMKKIVEAAVQMMGDVPYSNYVFLSLGPGRGGIEHLNSAAITFEGKDISTQEGKTRMYSFLAHEYFHHYNVKRIRPVELGPFDYEKENRTNLLWVAEGFTVYYEYLLVHRAGLMTEQELYHAFQANISAYENSPGHLFQSATQASYETWSDGPFGRTGDEVNKTISYYDKGPVLGLLIDFTIRHATANRKNLDDVMRALYKEYYQEKKRGFTDKEFQLVCERIAGIRLDTLFGYASTVDVIDYPKYFAYGGLAIDTATRFIPGAWTGLNLRVKKDSVEIGSVDWQSPAATAGFKRGERILAINGTPAGGASCTAWLREAKPGDAAELLIDSAGNQVKKRMFISQKSAKSFQIKPLENAGALEKEILSAWLRTASLH